MNKTERCFEFLEKDFLIQDKKLKNEIIDKFGPSALLNFVNLFQYFYYEYISDNDIENLYSIDLTIFFDFDIVMENFFENLERKHRWELKETTY